MNVEKMGQVFTPAHIVEDMKSLIKNKGRKLEPSCGDGAFLKHIDIDVSIEIDKVVGHKNSILMDFYDYSVSEKFDTIIGNPPYVAYKNIDKLTKSKLDESIFDKRTNLYIHFIYKCFLHLEKNGEIIFITPREFLKSCSSMKLNNILWNNGTITDILDFGDNNIFKGYSPNVIIWRYEKDNFKREFLYNGKKKMLSFNKGQFFFSNEKLVREFSEFFYVKVGGVSGCDKVFSHQSGEIESVYSKTVNDGSLRNFIYEDRMNTHLIKNRKILENRYLNGEWYNWIRKFYISNDERVYVNCKTRNKEPFFYNKCRYYDGSVLGIFFKKNFNVKEVIQVLNSLNWKDLGFMHDKRYIFTQRTLESCLLPDIFK